MTESLLPEHPGIETLPNSSNGLGSLDGLLRMMLGTHYKPVTVKDSVTFFKTGPSSKQGRLIFRV